MSQEIDEDSIEIAGYILPKGSSAESIAKVITAEADRLDAKADLCRAEAELLTASLATAKWNATIRSMN